MYIYVYLYYVYMCVCKCFCVCKHSPTPTLILTLTPTPTHISTHTRNQSLSLSLSISQIFQNKEAATAFPAIANLCFQTAECQPPPLPPSSYQSNEVLASSDHLCISKLPFTSLTLARAFVP